MDGILLYLDQRTTKRGDKGTGQFARLDFDEIVTALVGLRGRIRLSLDNYLYVLVRDRSILL